jgi:hypothetical protein
VWCKTDKKPRTEHFLRSAQLNIIVDNSELVEVVSAVIGEKNGKVFKTHNFDWTSQVKTT